MKRSSGKNKITKEEKEKRRIKRAFKNKIKSIFVTAGFDEIKIRNKHFHLGTRTVEFDSLFFYENIILVCEDTTSQKKDMDHIRKKKEAFTELDNNKKEFLEFIYKTFTEESVKLRNIDATRIKFFYLYFSLHELCLSDEELKRYELIRFVEAQTLNYFYRMSQCIKKSVRNEIFKFLNLKNEHIGDASSESAKKVINTTIIYPNEFTGLSNGVKIVSFMMSPDSLLNTCYVMRKDNWEESMWFYQRLIDKNKLKKIRKYLVEKGESFYNNIIVGLPDNVQFSDFKGNSIDIREFERYENCRMEIPDEINSICVIDGQHRIYAHYEGLENDKDEQKIKSLRRKLHLLVTGLIFPHEMSEIERMKIQSEIFLDINSNAKPVQAEVLLHIKGIKDPLSDVGLARQVIVKLNKGRLFLNKFGLSSLDQGKIKVASIIKFALRYLVTITPTNDRISFFTYWDGDKKALLDKNEKALTEYISFCVSNLEVYFSALKNRFLDQWEDPKSKILSVISLNGFILAYIEQLRINGIKDFDYFNNCFINLRVDFSKEEFPFTSSQYKMFSTLIFNQSFNQIEVEKNDMNVLG